MKVYFVKQLEIHKANPRYYPIKTFESEKARKEWLLGAYNAATTYFGDTSSSFEEFLKMHEYELDEMEVDR